MTTSIYRPIYKTWLVVYLTLVLGILLWMFGRLFQLGTVFSPEYRQYPSGLIIVFVIMAVLAASVFVGSFTGKRYLGIICLGVFSAIAVVALWIIKLIIDQWDTTTMLYVVLMFVCIIVGLAFEFLARWKVAIVAWIAFAATISTIVTWWLYDTWGTSFLFWLVIVAAIAVFIVVCWTFYLIPRRLLGV